MGARAELMAVQAAADQVGAVEIFYEGLGDEQIEQVDRQDDQNDGQDQ